MLEKKTVALKDIADAFEDINDFTTCYLNTATGEVVFLLEEGEEEDEELQEEIDAAPSGSISPCRTLIP